MQHLFISGLDNTASNTYFICIFHTRQQVLLRLNSLDLEPYYNNNSLDFIEVITNKAKSELATLIHELPIYEEEFFYIMIIYKFHKKEIKMSFQCIWINLCYYRHTSYIFNYGIT